MVIPRSQPMRTPPEWSQLADPEGGKKRHAGPNCQRRKETVTSPRQSRLHPACSQSHCQRALNVCLWMCMWLSGEGAYLSRTTPCVQSSVPQKTSVEVRAWKPALWRWIQEGWVMLRYIEGLRPPWVTGDSISKKFSLCHIKETMLVYC